MLLCCMASEIVKIFLLQHNGQRMQTIPAEHVHVCWYGRWYWCIPNFYRRIVLNGVLYTLELGEAFVMMRVYGLACVHANICTNRNFWLNDFLCFSPHQTKIILVLLPTPWTHLILILMRMWVRERVGMQARPHSQKAKHTLYDVVCGVL